MCTKYFFFRDITLKGVTLRYLLKNFANFYKFSMKTMKVVTFMIFMCNRFIKIIKNFTFLYKIYKLQ